MIDVGPRRHDILPGDRVGLCRMPAGRLCRVCGPCRPISSSCCPPASTRRPPPPLMLKGMTAEYLLHRTYRRPARRRHPGPRRRRRRRPFLCQWAAHLGARVIGTVGTTEKARIARDAMAATIRSWRRTTISSPRSGRSPRATAPTWSMTASARRASPARSRRWPCAAISSSTARRPGCPTRSRTPCWRRSPRR